MKLILLGYMASGKSLIAKEISAILKFDCIDLDHYIEVKVGLPIPAIFEEHGEIYFRKQEQLCLTELLSSSKKNVVIALGGGTPCYSNNMDLIGTNNDCKSVYLKVSLTNLVDRLMTENSLRPLVAHLSTRDEILEFVGKHLFERAHYYNQAEFSVDANNTVEDIIETILFKLF